MNDRSSWVRAMVAAGALGLAASVAGPAAHAQDAPIAPSYNGHSVGYWTGDTLHVDTVGIEGSTALDAARNPHSAKLHLVWTVQRVAPDKLHLHITLYDDEAFVEPVATTNIWRRKPFKGWQVLDDASCFENNRESIDKEGVPGFVHF